jgi:hypothetical protein
MATVLIARPVDYGYLKGPSAQADFPDGKRTDMPELSELIREYSGLLDQESLIAERKERLRAAIADELARRNLKSTSTEYGSAARTSRFKLLPRQVPVLSMLTGEDLLFFATFTPARVKEVLVPKYGRETLIPLFDIQETETLVVKRSPGGFRQSQAFSNGRPVKQSGDGLASVQL